LPAVHAQIEDEDDDEYEDEYEAYAAPESQDLKYS
jgi:hypothetical protein